MLQKMLILATAALASCSALDAAEPAHAVIDWTAWDTLLRHHVEDGRVDYDGLSAEPDLQSTVDAIAGADLTGHDRDSVLAFSINSYNVLAARAILNGRSPESAFGRLTFFFRDKYLVAGEELSLHAFENERILALGEPRVHFAIVCASMSCPALRSEAYVPSRLDQQLDDAARQFVNDPGKNSFDIDNGKARISKIFKWFRSDFEAASGSIQNYLAEWVEDGELTKALQNDRMKIGFQPYDWSLNGTFSRVDR